MNDIGNSGERLATETFDRYSIEHLHRYAIAAELCANADVLDIASGEGYGSNILANAARSVCGVDISETAVKHASNKYRRDNLRYLQGSADKIPLATGSLDRVVSYETLEHHDLHEEMFGEIRRVIRNDGLLIMSTPDRRNYSDIPGLKNHFHVRELYLEEFRSLAKRHFKHVSIAFQEVSLIGLITPETPLNSNFRYFSGDFERISESSTIARSEYNICFASDAALPILTTSAFDGRRVLESIVNTASTNLEKSSAEVEKLRASNSYRLGRMLTYPYRLFHSLVSG